MEAYKNTKVWRCDAFVSQLRRREIEIRFLLLVRLQLLQRRAQLAQDVGHGTCLVQHAVLERPQHVSHGEGRYAGLLKTSKSAKPLRHFWGVQNSPRSY